MQCRICGNASGNRAYVVAEMMFATRDPFDYFQCAECGCLQIDRYPEDVARYYGPDYYSYASGVQDEKGLERFRAALRDRHEIGERGPLIRFLRKEGSNPLLANLAPILKDRRQRILDVGCGSGDLLRSLDRIGFHEVSGADPYVDGELTFGPRGRIHKKTLADMPGSFDVLFMMHSLEHMPAQAAIFREIAGHLAPSGTAVLGLPLASSFAWEHYGVDWVQLDAPRHFYLHTPTSLARLAEGAGLSIERVVYDSTAFQFWGSEQYRHGMGLTDPRSLARHSIDGSMFTREAMGEFRRRSEELNAASRGDQALFFLRKAH